MKIAIVHEWLETYAGAERVLEQLLKVYPDADLFALVDFLPKDQRSFIMNKPVTTSFIQRLPFAKKKFRNYLPLFPLAIQQLDLSSYDLVISSSHAVAKGVITGPDQCHICYCHSPIRYAWDLQHEYLHESGIEKGPKSWFLRYILQKIRLWDAQTATSVDHFIANSNFIAKRIRKFYGRNSTVIFPPVAVDDFDFCDNKKDFYLTASRQVPYKKIHLIVEAFHNMPKKKLVVIGDGPEAKKINAIASDSDNIKILGHQPFSVLKDHMQRAKAFVFAAKEDFGIIPLEAQACGTPIIAYGRGGALDTVNKETGLFFHQQTSDAIANAIKDFEKHTFEPNHCRKNAEKFCEERFRNEISTFVNNNT